MTSVIRAKDIQTSTMDAEGKELKNQAAERNSKLKARAKERKMPKLKPITYITTKPTASKIKKSPKNGDQDIQIIREVYNKKTTSEEIKTIENLRKEREQLKMKLEKANADIKEKDIRNARSLIREIGLKLDM